MRSELTILKLGGSVITFKDKPLTPNLPVIKRIAREVAASNTAPLIIVHGGGSFGHPLAAEYDIASGLKRPRQMVGFAKTHNAMVKLNMLVVEALLEEGVPAVGIAPSSFIVTRLGRIVSLYRDALESAIKLGFTPVLYGDTVLDYDQGIAILSGDQLAARLAMEFNAKRIIFGVDVDGLYTSDPKASPEANLLGKLTLDELGRVISVASGSKSVDVTGGMRGKILEIIEPVSMGIEVLIISALRENNVYRALRGEDVIGTRIIKE